MCFINRSGGIIATPPNTWLFPKRRSSTSRWRIPFRSGKITGRSPTAGAKNPSRSRGHTPCNSTGSVERAFETPGQDRRRRGDVQIAEPAPYLEAASRQLPGPFRTDQKCDVAIRFKQPAAEVSAESACADHESTHGDRFRIRRSPGERAGSRRFLGVRQVNRVAVLASINLCAELCADLLGVGEPSFQVSRAELAFRVFLIASTHPQRAPLHLGSVGERCNHL